MSELGYRFPGARPFELGQDDIFFGRDRDIVRLYRMTKLRQLVVFHGKSGIGKSSLINAGFIPKVRQEQHFEPVRVRFKSYDRDHPEELSLIEKTRAAITREQESRATFLDKLIQHEPTLWHDIKEHQIVHQGTDR